MLDQAFLSEQVVLAAAVLEQCVEEFRVEEFWCNGMIALVPLKEVYRKSAMQTHRVSDHLHRIVYTLRKALEGVIGDC